MKKALTLSIVIPVYNEEDYLKACLDCVAAQTVKPLQVIVVNNGSSDKTAKIASTYKFVTLLKEPRRGVAYARDLGFGAVKADLIGRIDADTHLPPDWVENVVAMFAAQPKMDAVSGPTGAYDLPGQRVTLRLTKIIRTSLFYIGHRATKYLYGANMAMRTTAWRAVAGKTCYLPGIHEDNDLAIHLEDAGKSVHYSNKLTALVSYRRADNTPRQALKYAFMEPYTFRQHGMFSVQAWLGGFILITAYPFLRFFRKGYDPQKHRMSLRKFIRTKPHPRVQPME